MLTRTEAREILERYKIPLGADFHALPPSSVVLLWEYAKLRGYRKSRNAPGSTARMFHAYLQRRSAGQPMTAELWSSGVGR